MPVLAKYEDCTGCGACSDSCHNKAIKMVPRNGFGHLYPYVEKDKCIECGACEKSCPFVEKTLEQIPPQKCYAAWVKDIEENRKSTSGGMATLFAQRIIDLGGVVYGCANIGIEFKHVRVDNREALESLRGSKYVQSNLAGIYTNIRLDLKAGTQVLFIGTPCQVAGLRTFLKREYENLITVDLICHGVPSAIMLQKHLSTKCRLSDITGVSFREDGFNLKVYNNSNILYQSNLWKERYKDAYYTAFIKGYNYRDNCYSCKYANRKRCGDITIGDFWGLGRTVPFNSAHPNAGISAVLTNTSKGQSFFDSLADSLYVYERTVEEAVAGNPQLQHPVKKTRRIKIFRYLVNHGYSLKSALYMTDFYLLPIYWVLNKIRNR